MDPENVKSTFNDTKKHSSPRSTRKTHCRSLPLTAGPWCVLCLQSKLQARQEELAARLHRGGSLGPRKEPKARACRVDRFRTSTRSLTLKTPTQVVEDIFSRSLTLFRERVHFGNHSIRLLGVGVTNLSREPLRQLDLFEEDPGSRERATNRSRVTDAIRKKLGDGAILRGRLLEGRERK